MAQSLSDCSAHGPITDGTSPPSHFTTLYSTSVLSPYKLDAELRVLRCPFPPPSLLITHCSFSTDTFLISVAPYCCWNTLPCHAASQFRPWLISRTVAAWTLWLDCRAWPYPFEPSGLRRYFVCRRAAACDRPTVKQWWNDSDRDNRSTVPVPLCSLHGECLGSNTGLRIDKPSTRCLSSGAE